ncbi:MULTISPECIES: TlpA family protein disulfide reductase [unclassified Nocardioides]|uniref:TlpA family protein disulfide reductase n=1 Tax=unclassified Nocardioides TaxID=2615069 RepID=UPI0009F10597|nr:MULTISPECIES: TlpA disulfide reductase family protein [unclassified Nocardioides]GAW49216.1 Redoxin domain protein (Precursor) [Nocardioides sp. PD653-B2]GAW55704.1 Redoxin domain protein (Precursor) [Nocardioides sp. PD653]
MRWIISAVVIGLLTLAGCGTTTANSPAAGGAPIGTGKVADYDFSGTTLSGAAFNGSTLKGKPTVLWFWAPWCPTCLGQSPNVAELGKKYAGKVNIVAVSGLATKEMIDDIAPAIHNVTHLVDTKGTIWNHFHVEAQSTFTVISADGEIVSEGYLEDAQLDALVARLAG